MLNPTWGPGVLETFKLVQQRRHEGKHPQVGVTDPMGVEFHTNDTRVSWHAGNYTLSQVLHLGPHLVLKALL